MKIIVTHNSPDMDAITSVWLIKKFLQGWEDSQVQFVPAGERLRGSPRPLNDSSASGVNQSQSLARQQFSKSDSSGELFKRSFRGEAHPSKTIEIIDGHEVIHVDTGLGPLDHHQTSSDEVCGASLTFDFVKRVGSWELGVGSSNKIKNKIEAVSRMVKVVVDIDHFKEVFRKDPLSDYHEFDLAAILDGLKLEFPGQDDYYAEFVIKCLDAVLHEFENRIWAEKEIKEDGIKFETRFGKGMGFETINDSVIKLAQKMGYVIVVRKDPRKGYVRIKAKPAQDERERDIDLTLVYEKLRKMDPGATWFLHVSKKMLLNGSVKNPKMRPTRLGLNDIIAVLEKI